MVKMDKAILSAVAATLLSASPALAATTVSGDTYFVAQFEGMDCPVQGGPSGGFNNCWATTNGVSATPPTNPNASLVVAKFEADGGFEKNPVWTTFTESDVTITKTGNTLNFTYNMGAGDPVLKYITIKQAQDDYGLYYNSAGFASGTTYTFDLSRYNPDGWSHLTVYDSVATAVPEPGTWAMMLLGFGAIGFAMRRRRREGALLQMA